jgi:hypothetical protein
MGAIINGVAEFVADRVKRNVSHVRDSRDPNRKLALVERLLAISASGSTSGHEIAVSRFVFGRQYWNEPFLR